MTLHVNWTRNTYYPTGYKKWTIPQCRNIFKQHEFGIEKVPGGYIITAQVRGASICQAYYDPVPIQLQSRIFHRKDIQAFAQMLINTAKLNDEGESNEQPED